MEDINSSNFDEKVASGLVFVDFSADWCGPCRMITPILEDLSKEYENKVNFFKVDVDENSTLAEKFRIMSVPTIIIFKDGKIVESIIGGVSKDKFVEQINKFS